MKRLFGFDPTLSTVRKEFLAGITTFLTMSYILAVNPNIFSELEGMPTGSVFTATALSGIVGCLAMALCGKLPFGLAPGMGLNAFFVFKFVFINEESLKKVGDKQTPKTEVVKDAELEIQN